MKFFCRILVFVFLLAAIPQHLFAAAAQKGNLTGLICDETTNEGLPFASVQLNALDDPLFIKGAISDINGEFFISEVPFGKYNIQASFMGYVQAELVIEIKQRKTKLEIALLKKNFTLSEVEITAEKEMVEQSIQKTTVNVSKDATLIGGSAVDVMQTLPSVDFDINGQIQYRGSDKVTLLLNGRKSELVKSLDQIPADQIEKIELINNPSAKYDADGMSGIINVVLKSGNKGNNKTTVMLYAGLPETYGGNAGFSGSTPKSNYFVNGGYNHKTKFQTKEHLRENYGDPNTPDYYQYDRQDEILNDLLINASYDYSITNNQQITVSLLGSKTFNTADRSIAYTTLQNDQPIFDSHKDIDISLDNYSIDGDLEYQYNFRKEGQKLDANFHYSMLDQSQIMKNAFYSEYAGESTELQNTNAGQLNKESVLAVNYKHPFEEIIKFETGYQYSGQDLMNDFTSVSFDPLLGVWQNDSALNNTFHYLQGIHAVYANLNAKFRFFDLQVGLRGEYTSNEQVDEQKDAYFNLFPSLTLSRQFSNHFNGFIAYNKRINRPTIKMLNPYTNEYADLLNMHVGNPDLKPEYVNSFEVGTLYTFEKASGSGSVYYRNIDQAISRIKSASNDSALLVTFMNLDNAKLLGGEISGSYKLFSWWSINATGSVFHTTLKGDYGPNKIDRSHTGWLANLSNRFKLPFGIALQVNGYYRSKLPDVMGTYIERYYVDMALNKSILQNRGKLIFKVSDVFNTYRYGLDLAGIDENGNGYSQQNRRKNESQYFILSFVYNIDGKEKQKKHDSFYLESFDK